MILRVRTLCKDVPIGYNFDQVLEKGMSLYKPLGYFIMSPHRTSSGILWVAEAATIPPFKFVKGSIKYKYSNKLGKWSKIINHKGLSKNR